MIERKPEEFKISCMNDIKSLFTSPNGLYAGFGNRINVSPPLSFSLTAAK